MRGSAGGRGLPCSICEYHDEFEETRRYVKLTVLDDVLIVSLKELER